MRKLSTLFLCLVALASGSAAAHAQAVPTASAGGQFFRAFRIPDVAGTFRFSVSASERLTFGYSAENETIAYTTISGNAAYLSDSLVHPFIFIYSGGYLGNTSGQPSAPFQELSLSQTFNTKHWTFNLADSVHYLPETPSTGLSGLPGLGDLGIPTGIDPEQGILTPYATRVDNTSSASASRKLTGSTSLNGSGSYTEDRFLNYSGGIQTNTSFGSGGIAHRVNALSSVSVQYTYSKFSYIDLDGSFVSQAITGTYQRQFTRQFAVIASAGPERISGSSLTGKGPSLTYTADLRATYTGSLSSGASASVSYTRATNSGSGITLGAETDTVSLSAGRRLTRDTQLSAQANYGRSSGLQVLTTLPLNSDSFIASVQATRALNRALAAYASYSLQYQSYGGTALGLTPLNGFSHVLGFGLTYSPTLLHVGRQ